MVAHLIGTWGSARSTFAGCDRAVGQASDRAVDLGPPQRQALSLAVLGRGEPVSALARRHGVSRQFCYRQADKARQALDDAFSDATHERDVLFELPVT